MRLVQPGTRIGQASECFVYWKDPSTSDTWGLNFTSPIDAKQFRECCVSSDKQTHPFIWLSCIFTMFTHHDFPVFRMEADPTAAAECGPGRPPAGRPPPRPRGRGSRSAPARTPRRWWPGAGARQRGASSGSSSRAGEEQARSRTDTEVSQAEADSEIKLRFASI